MPILSGSAYIGQLFDGKTNQLIHEKFLWTQPIPVKEANITSVETSSQIENSIRDRMNNLKVSAHLQLDLAFIKVIYFKVGLF